MKWDATEPSQNQFNFSSGDTVATYAATTARSSTATRSSGTPAAQLGVEPVGERDAVGDGEPHHQGRGPLQGQRHSWDVVNEAFADNGARRSESPFQQKLGDGYIESAFTTAHAADPDAKLCINDYSIESVNTKSTAIYNLVKDFKARGVPIDCVGFQSHLIVGQVPSDFQQSLQGRRARRRRPDHRARHPHADPVGLVEAGAAGSGLQEGVPGLPRGHPCQGVTIWGISDKYSSVPDTFSGQAPPWSGTTTTRRSRRTTPSSPRSASTRRRRPPPRRAHAHHPDPTPTPTATPTPTTPTPTPTSGPAGCSVVYSANQWNTGFTANVTIKNTSSSALNGWTLKFTFPSGQTITQAWSPRRSSPAPR